MSHVFGCLVKKKNEREKEKKVEKRRKHKVKEMFRLENMNMWQMRIRKMDDATATQYQLQTLVFKWINGARILYYLSLLIAASLLFIHRVANETNFGRTVRRFHYFLRGLYIWVYFFSSSVRQAHIYIHIYTYILISTNTSDTCIGGKFIAQQHLPP